MPEPEDTVWIVGTGANLGALEDDLADTDAIIEETWPAGQSGTITALVRSGRDAVDTAVAALGTDAQVFDTADGARSAATKRAAG